MTRWWRAYDGAVDDPKLCLLTDRQHRAWFNLCCITSQNGGILPSIEAIAFKLRMTSAKARALVDELKAAKLIDVREDGAYAPHNWDTRQYKSDVTDPTAPERMRRYRKNRKSVTPNTVTVTPTRAETEQKGICANAPPRDLKAEYFNRGREVLGQSAGGLLSKLLKACGNGNEDDPNAIPKARAHIETASTKTNPAQWIGRVLAPPKPGATPTLLLTESGNPWPEGIV